MLRILQVSIRIAVGTEIETLGALNLVAMAFRVLQYYLACKAVACLLGLDVWLVPHGSTQWSVPVRSNSLPVTAVTARQDTCITVGIVLERSVSIPLYVAQLLIQFACHTCAAQLTVLGGNPDSHVNGTALQLHVADFAVSPGLGISPSPTVILYPAVVLYTELQAQGIQDLPGNHRQFCKLGGLCQLMLVQGHDMSFCRI